MKIAACCKKNIIADFSEENVNFVFFEIVKGKIASAEEIPFMAGSTEQCADFLVKHEVDLLLSPALGDDIKDILDNVGVHLIDNLTGDARTLVEAYLEGTLFDNPKYFLK
ncbi:MAG: hypothetical protein IKB77_03020 [Lentisphaeria bacterium]|nr:hypothetical protein [Lentisphaeria bacterium]